MKTGIRNSSLLWLLLAFLLIPSILQADPGDKYCITPPFITAGLKPNLLLMIDNSASMYDLAYQDSTNYYCANSPTTACTFGTTCGGAATCRTAGTTTTTTTYASKACIADTDCPNSVAVTKARACTANTDCPTYNVTHSNADGCNGAQQKCKNDNVTIPKCSGGYCTKCDGTSASGQDCVSSSTTVFAPVACTSDATCSGFTCPATCVAPACICSASTSDKCNNKCDAQHQCYDTTYNTGTTYPGYFDAAVTYGFDFTNNNFTSGATMPDPCTYSAGTPKYVCVNTTGTGTSEVVVGDATGFVAKGNFLNWLTASKFDIEKQILTGGKYDPTSQVLIGESRGCGGRKFIKKVPGMNLNFAVRGGTAAGIGSTTSLATEYGQTYIDISAGTYNEADCLAAMDDWMAVASPTPPALGGFQNDTKGCVGTATTFGTNVTATSFWNHVLHDCYQGMTGGASGYSTNLNALELECKSIYATIAADTMTDPSAGYAVCSKVLTYKDSSGVDQTGYLGACWNGTDFSTNCTAAQQVKRMADYCVLNVNTSPVTDPSSTALATYGQSAPGLIMELGLLNTQPIGIFPVKVALATPPTGLIVKYSDRIRFGAQTFMNNGSGTECGGSSLIRCINVCAVTRTRMCYFDTDCPFVSGSATVHEGCGGLERADGAKIISYVGAGHCSVTTTKACNVDYDCHSETPADQYCEPSLGSGKCSVTTTTACNIDADCASLTPSGQFCKPDHSSGLIKQIDDIPATSWTPFAEGFYNAMGYFARTSDYTDKINPPASRHIDILHPDDKFNFLSAPNTQTSYESDKNPSQYRCQSNNLLLITDGMTTTDQNSASEGLATLYAPQVPYTIGGTTFKPADTSTSPVTPATTGYNSADNHGYDATNKCPPYAGSRSLNNLAWVAKNRNIKTLSTSSPASTTPPGSASESITTYVVYSGPQTSTEPGLCDPKTLMSSTAINGGTTLYAATDPTSFNAQMDMAMSTVAAKAASGTAASILSNSEGSGANILQAVFYPKKIFEAGTAVSWVGEMQNLWYFVDPYIQNSTIREDTDNDRTLNLVFDNVVRFAFDSSSDKTMVQRYRDSDGDAVVTDSDKVGGLIDPDFVKSIWRAGMKLWERNDDITRTPHDHRTIYTGAYSTPDSTPQLFDVDGAFDTKTELWTNLQIPAGTPEERLALTGKLINYVRGNDQEDDPAAPCLNSPSCTYRKRKVTMSVCSGNFQKRCTLATAATDCPTGDSCMNVNSEWKLGDIISSTPRVQSTVRLNTYNLPPPGGYNDKSYQSFIGSNDYADRGTVYVGANDGMLHAFKLGTLSVAASGFRKASLGGVPAELGREQWAFIPMNSFPFLKYMTDKDYSHLYYNDGRTVVFDASIGDTDTGTCVRSTYWLCPKPANGSIPMVDSSNDLDPTKNVWRTVVIAGMGLGGASRDNVVGETCTEGAAGSCVRTPVSGLGYSSYYALDVTHPNSPPKFLWEFSNNLLGFSTSAPAIVRIGNSVNPRDTNGRWFAVFGNGPFGPIDKGSHQFKAQSSHHLRFFVVDLRTGTLVRTIAFDGTGGTPNITNAFAGTLLSGSVDADRRDPTKIGHYQDDAIYAGYVQLGADGKWTDGGVVRILTKEDIDPNNWSASAVITGIGPVTTAVARSQDTKNRNLWLYFGTGRYFYRDAVSLDDNDTRRALFGVQEPCYNTATTPGNVLDKTCVATVAASDLEDQTDRLATTTTAIASGKKGWRIDLNIKTAAEGAERVVTDTVALTNGTVFFTSFKPTLDICGYGGNSFLWGVKYDTGGAPLASSLVGKALIQLSTGEFKEVDLQNAFQDQGNRRMATPMTGKPPSDAPPIVSTSQNKPLKKILHIQEH